MPDFGDSTDLESGRYQFEGKVDPNAPSVANGQITPEQWREYQKQRRRAAILGTVTTVGGMLAAGPLASAMFGGGGAAAASSGIGGLPAGMGVGGSTIGGSVAAPLVASGAGTAAAGTGASMAAKAGTSRLIPALVQGGGDAIKGLLGVRSAGKDREAEAEREKRRLEQEMAIATLTDKRARDISADELSLDESKLDPMRELMAQIAAAEKLDRLLNTAPLEMDFSGSRPGSFAPVVRGGTANYRPSDDLRTAATNARTATLQGQGATRVTPASQGRALLDLLSQGQARSPVTNSTMPVPTDRGFRGPMSPVNPDYRNTGYAGPNPGTLPPQTTGRPMLMPGDPTQMSPDIDNLLGAPPNPFALSITDLQQPGVVKRPMPRRPLRRTMRPAA